MWCQNLYKTCRCLEISIGNINTTESESRKKRNLHSSRPHIWCNGVNKTVLLQTKYSEKLCHTVSDNSDNSNLIHLMLLILNTNTSITSFITNSQCFKWSWLESCYQTTVVIKNSYQSGILWHYVYLFTMII